MENALAAEETLPGITSSGWGSLSLDICNKLDELPGRNDALFDHAGQQTIFSSREWYQTVLTHGLPSGGEPRFLLCRRGDDPIVLFPLLVRGRDAESLTTPYTCLHRPLVAPGSDEQLLVSAGYLIGRFLRRWAVIRLDALAPEDPEWRPLTIGLRRSGLLSYWFDHFGNWYQPLQTWPDYLAARSGSLRETIRRKTKRLAWEIEILDGTERLEHGIAEFETVYNRSWKEPEPFPAFNPALMRLAAARGMLRLGISRFEGRSVAAQFWIVEKLPGHHRATVLKLAHDEAHKAQSPGTVLTAFMIRALLERDAVQEIDFGRGDDPYKRLWAGIRRQRKGLLLINPRRPRGLSNLALTAAGAVRRRLRRIKIFAARSGTPHATY